MRTIYAKNVVLGAGAMGAATAYRLAKRGEPVLLIERFELGHDRGSSHGAARITRHSYADPHYARLTPYAFQAWREVEADACKPLYIRTGGISFGPVSNGYCAAVAANLAEIGVPHRRLSAREVAIDCPVFRLPQGFDAVFEPDAGMIAAERAVAAQIELAQRFGGDRAQILERTRVDRIDLDSDRPTLVTSDARIVAERLAIAPGSWAGSLLPGLAFDLTPTRQSVIYLKPDDPDRFAIGKLPVFIYMGESEDDQFYGMPDFLGRGVKAARHGGPAVDPDAVDRTVGADAIDRVRAFLRGFVPAAADAPLHASETCLYTMAPGEQFRIGPVRGRDDVLLVSPCSGHGFKFSSLIGRVVADLMTLGETEIAIDPWRHEWISAK